jgi:hypothetical protein
VEPRLGGWHRAQVRYTYVRSGTGRMATAPALLLALCEGLPALTRHILVGAGWRALPAAAATCRALRALVRTGGTWVAACARLWATKAFVPAAARRLLQLGRGREACEVALRDATRRRLTVAELQRLFWRYARGGGAVDYGTAPFTHYRYGVGGGVLAGCSWAEAQRQPALKKNKSFSPRLMMSLNTWQLCPDLAHLLPALAVLQLMQHC